MTVTEVPALCCDGCGDIVESVDEDGHGKCCHDLPERWRRGEDGLYNRHTEYDSEVEDDEEHDEEVEDDRPRCISCGSMEWNATATQRVSTVENEEDETIYYDWNDFNVEVLCGQCGRNAGLDHSIEAC